LNRSEQYCEQYLNDSCVIKTTKCNTSSST